MKRRILSLLTALAVSLSMMSSTLNVSAAGTGSSDSTAVTADTEEADVSDESTAVASASSLSDSASASSLSDSASDDETSDDSDVTELIEDISDDEASPATDDSLNGLDTEINLTVSWMTSSGSTIETREIDGEETSVNTIYMGMDTKGSYIYRAQIDFATSGITVHDPGTITIRIPAHLFKNRHSDDWTYGTSKSEETLGAGDYCTLSVPEEGSEIGDNEFVYSYDAETDEYVLTNVKSIEPGHHWYGQVSYTVPRPSEIIDGVQTDVDGNVKNEVFADYDFQAKVTIVENDEVAAEAESNILKAQADTRITDPHVTKSYSQEYDSWPSDWPDDLKVAGKDDTDDYFYLVWRVYGYTDWADAQDTQPFNLVYQELGVTDGEVVGYFLENSYGQYQWSNGSSDYISEDPYWNGVKSDFWAYSITNDFYVLTRHPKTLISEGQSETISNTIQVTKTGVDDGTDHVKTSTASFDLSTLIFKAPPGEQKLDKRAGDTKVGAFTLLQNGNDIENLFYENTMEVVEPDLVLDENGDPTNAEDYTRSYTAELVDDLLYLSSDYTEHLSGSDYSISYARMYDARAYDWTTSDTSSVYQWVEADMTDQKFYLYGQFNGDDGSDTWQEIGCWTTEGTLYYPKSFDYSGSFDDGNGNTHIDFAEDSYNGYDLEWVPLPEGVTAIKLVYTSNHMKVNALLSAYVTLHPSEHVLDLIENRNSISLTNINTLLLYDSNGNLAGVEGTYEGEATDSVKAHDEAVYHADMYHDQASISLSSIDQDSQIAKGVVSQTNDTASKQTIIHYAINAGEYVGYDRNLYTDEEIRALNLIDPQQEAVFYDLLPAGMETDVSTVHAYQVSPAKSNGATSDPYIGVSDVSSAGEPVVGQEFEVSAQVIRNWRGTGRTMLIAHVTVPDGVENLCNFQSWTTSKNFLGSYIRLEFDGYYSWSEYADRGGTLHNIAAYQTGNDEITDGYGNDTTDYIGYSSSRSDFHYLDGIQEDSEEQIATDENTAKQFLYVEDTTSVNPLVAADMSITKRVKGPRGITWSTGHDGEPEVEVTTGEYYTYKIHMGSDAGSETGNIVFFDMLEQYQPDGVSEQWRGTLVSIDTSYLTEKGIEPVIYYSTVSGITDPDYSDLEDTTVWSTEEPEDLSTVTAIAIDCRKKSDGSDYWLPENQALAVYITMQAPTNENVVADLSARNIKAYNSVYALSNVRSTNGSTSESKSKASGYTEVSLYYKEIEVTKTWKDNEDMYGERPDNIRVTLLADGSEVRSAVLGRNEDGTENWTVLWKGLPKYSTDGTEIEYTVQEEQIGEDGTAVTLTPISEDSEDSRIRYEVPEDMSTAEWEQVLNDWQLSSSQETVQTPLSLTEEQKTDDTGAQTEDVTVQIEDPADTASVYLVHLLTNGEKSGMTGILSSVNGWTCTFRDLPLSDASGETVEYTAVTEKTSVHVSGEWADGALKSGVTVHLLANGLDTGKTLLLSDENGWSGDFTGLDSSDPATGESVTYTVTEDWVTKEDDSDYGIERTDYSLMNGSAVTSVNVRKIWDDSIPEEEIREIDVQLMNGSTVVDTATLSAENNWQYTFENLDVLDENGDLIVYEVQEVIPEDRNYQVFVTQYGSGIYLTNKEKLTSFSGQKTWDDSENQDGKRPESVTVRLLADGEPALDEEGNAIVREVSASDQWEYSFTDLPEWNEDGTKIVYSVTEDAVADYTTAYSGNDIINRYTPGMTSITVVKNWDDENNADGIRPDSVTIHLLADGQDTGKTVILNEENQWKAVFTELEQKKDGQDIQYTVSEDVPEGYTEEITGSPVEGFVIRNIHEPEPSETSGETNEESGGNSSSSNSSSSSGSSSSSYSSSGSSSSSHSSSHSDSDSDSSSDETRGESSTISSSPNTVDEETGTIEAQNFTDNPSQPVRVGRAAVRTADDMRPGFWFALMILSAGTLFLFEVLWRRYHR